MTVGASAPPLNHSLEIGVENIDGSGALVLFAKIIHRICLVRQLLENGNCCACPAALLRVTGIVRSHGLGRMTKGGGEEPPLEVRVIFNISCNMQLASFREASFVVTQKCTSLSPTLRFEQSDDDSI